MEINGKEIRQAENAEVTVGTVSEFDVTIKECTRDCNIDGNETKINTAWIGGSFNIEVNGSVIKHSFKYLDTIRHKKNGEENKTFKGLMTSFGYDVEFDSASKKLTYTKSSEGIVPKLEGKITWLDSNGNKVNEVMVKGDRANATRIKATAKLSYQEGLSKDQSNIVFYNELPTTYLTTTKVPEEDSASFTVEGIIKDVVPELNSQGSQTGRYQIDMIVPSFFGVDVFTFVMLDKWTNVIEEEEVEISKEMFYMPDSDESFCKIGDTVKLSGDVENHTFGVVKAETLSKRTFGGGAQNVRNGFDRVEWTVKAGDLVTGEDIYDIEPIQEALKERDINLDNNYKRLKNNYEERNKGENKKSSSPKDAGGSSKPNPFANKGTTEKKNPFLK